jgi:hypothetical protein
MSSIVLAIISALSWVALGDVSTHVGGAITLLIVWGLLVWLLPRPQFSVATMLWVALGIRLILVGSPLALSDDLYRYLWEGQLAWAGGNPYLHPPADNIWAGGAYESLRLQVAHGEVSAIYPPLALWFFGLLAQVSTEPWIVKLTMGLADVGVVWMLVLILRGRHRHLGPAWLYALHPLGAIESAGSGHMESLALLLTLAAVHSWDRGKGGAAWAALGMGVKLLPGVLLLRLWRHGPTALAAALGLCIVATVPFVDAGVALGTGMRTYVEHWSFNAGLFTLIEAALGVYARPVAITIGAVLLLRAVRIHADPARLALWAGGLFVLLSPTVHPWYVLWAWVPALLCGVRSWTVLATLIPLSYAALASYDPTTSSWEEPWWPPLFSTLPFWVALTWEFVQHSTQPGPWAAGPLEKAPPSVSRTEPDVSILFPR